LSQLYHHLTIWMLVWIIVSIIPMFIFLKNRFETKWKSGWTKRGSGQSIFGWGWPQPIISLLGYSFF